MISVHILYPRSEGSHFDMNYYTETHMPMLADAIGDACKGWGASTVNGGAFEAIGWCHVESQEALDVALAEHGAAIMADVANYTNAAPELVVGNIAH